VTRAVCRSISRSPSHRSGPGVGKVARSVETARQPPWRSLCSVNDNGAEADHGLWARPGCFGQSGTLAGRHSATAATGRHPFRDKFGVVGLEQQPGSYYRAAAARARRLRAEATTRRLKEHLGEEVARYERLAEEIERASEPGSDFAPAEPAATSISEAPDP
jgi:hypothetical protein